MLTLRYVTTEGLQFSCINITAPTPSTVYVTSPHHGRPLLRTPEDGRLMLQELSDAAASSGRGGSFRAGNTTVVPSRRRWVILRGCRETEGSCCVGVRRETTDLLTSGLCLWIVCKLWWKCRDMSRVVLVGAFFGQTRKLADTYRRHTPRVRRCLRWRPEMERKSKFSTTNQRKYV